MRLTDLPTMVRNALPGQLKLQIPLATETDILQEIFSIGVGLSAAAAVGWALSHKSPKVYLEAYRKYKLDQADKKREALDSLMPLLKEWGARDIGAGTADIIGALEGGSILPEGFLDFSDSGSADSFMLKLLQDEYVDVDAL